MDHEILWLEPLSAWMENKTDPASQDDLMIDLREEWMKAVQETDTLLQTSSYLQKAFSQIQGKYEQQS